MKKTDQPASEVETIKPEEENQGAGFKRITDDIMAAAPEPSEHGPAAPFTNEGSENNAQPASSIFDRVPPATQGRTDSAGNIFDSNIHETDENGEPKLTITGKFRKKRGRAAKGFLADDSKQIQIANNEARYRAAGTTAAQVFFGTGIALFGDEWRPRIDKAQNVNEAEYIEGAFTDYFRAIDFKDLPPGMALAVALGSYAITRVSAPESKTKNRLKEWGERAWLKMKHMRARRFEKKSDKQQNAVEG